MILIRRTLMVGFEQKAKDLFGEIVINKGLIHQAGFGSRAIPTYVGEWIIAHYVGDSSPLRVKKSLLETVC
jgi:ATP-dependent Lon protease